MKCSKPIHLKGEFCTLQPLAQNHCDGLITAVKDGELWKLWYTSIPKPSEMQTEINHRLEMQQQGTMIPFAIIDNDSAMPIGMTTYLHIDSDNRRLEIGATWICASKQRTGINTEAKILLLTHAFESMGCNAVELRTHFLNQQSRRGIERLGAKLDGILRNHMILPDKTVRDTCVYSIIANEWPRVKTHLKWLVQKSERQCEHTE